MQRCKPVVSALLLSALPLYGASLPFHIASSAASLAELLAQAFAAAAIDRRKQPQ